MAAIAQKGTSLIIGFNNYVYTGYFMQDVDLEPTGEQDVVKDEDNATTTVLVSDLGTQISFNAIIKTTSGSIVPPALGSSVTINSVVYRTLSSSVKLTAKAAMLSYTGIKEASMTYT